RRPLRPRAKKKRAGDKKESPPGLPFFRLEAGRLRFDEVARANQVDPFRREGRLPCLVATYIEEQVGQITGMDTAELAAGWSIIMVDQVAAGGLRVGDVLAPTGHLENVKEAGFVRVADLDLVANPAEEGLITERAGRQVRGENEK